MLSMRYFIKMVIDFVVLWYLTMTAIDILYSHRAATSNYGSIQRWSFLSENVLDTDLLFLGSSRAMYHLSPAVMDSVLGTHSYNLGMPGADMSDVWARYMLYRQKHGTVPYVIINVDYFSLAKSLGVELYQFYPWFHNHLFRKYVFKKRHFPIVDRFVPMARFRGSRGQYLIKAPKSLKQGFSGFDKRMDMDKINHAELCFTIEPEIESAFCDLLDMIKADGAKVLLLASPMYKEALVRMSNPGQMREYYKNVAKARGILFLDYSDMSGISCDSSLFADRLHLNSAGAAAFSDSLANAIKKMNWIL